MKASKGAVGRVSEFTEGPYEVQYDQGSHGEHLAVVAPKSGCAVALITIEEDLQTVEHEDRNASNTVRDPTEIQDAHLLAASWRMKELIGRIAKLPLSRERSIGRALNPLADRNAIDRVIRDARVIEREIGEEIRKFSSRDASIREPSEELDESLEDTSPRP